MINQAIIDHKPAQGQDVIITTPLWWKTGKG